MFEKMRKLLLKFSCLLRQELSMLGPITTFHQTSKHTSKPLCNFHMQLKSFHSKFIQKQILQIKTRQSGHITTISIIQKVYIWCFFALKRKQKSK